MFRSLTELYHHRALIGALVTRQLASRYRGSLLGFFWSFLNPLVLMLVYTVVFQHFTKVGSFPHYSLYLFAGLLPWLWTTSAIHEGATSITASGHLITKSMFPAHVLPFSVLLTTGVHFVLTLPLYFLFFAIDGMLPTVSLIALPFIILLHALFLFGIMLLTSSLNVRFRDIQHVVGNVLTILFFLCPIIYSLQTVPEQYQFIFKLNPVAEIISLYHWALFGEGSFAWEQWGYVGFWAILFLMSGLAVYERGRERFAEFL